MLKQFIEKTIPTIRRFVQRMILLDEAVTQTSAPPSEEELQQLTERLISRKDELMDGEIIPLPFEKRKQLLAFFGIAANPFVDVVDPDVYYPGKTHEKAYKKLLHSIEDGISMGLVTAPSGMGKTLLLQRVKQSLPTDTIEVIDFRIEKGITRTALLKRILFAMGLSKIYRGQQAKVNDLVSLLITKILTCYEESGKRVVLLLDEAEFLSADILHLLKNISNIEQPDQKLVSVIVFGEDTLFKRLKLKTFKSIAGRMFVKESLNPWSLEETKKYLEYKCRSVQCPQNLFSEDIVNVIHVATGGICREINNLVYNALIEAFYMKKKVIDHDVLLKCLE